MPRTEYVMVIKASNGRTHAVRLGYTDAEGARRVAAKYRSDHPGQSVRLVRGKMGPPMDDKGKIYARRK